MYLIFVTTASKKRGWLLILDRDELGQSLPLHVYHVVRWKLLADTHPNKDSLEFHFFNGEVDLMRIRFDEYLENVYEALVLVEISRDLPIRGHRRSTKA